jgi:hypothetical protein
MNAALARCLKQTDGAIDIDSSEFGFRAIDGDLGSTVDHPIHSFKCCMSSVSIVQIAPHLSHAKSTVTALHYSDALAAGRELKRNCSSEKA